MKSKLLFSCLVCMSTQVLLAQNFVEASPPPPFAEVNAGSVAFADIDGDADQEVLITGEENAVGRSTRLYTNDGGGNFTEVTGIPFEDVWFSSVAFADVDGDSDQDVLITGLGPVGPLSKLYINDGNGVFSEVMGTPFEGVQASSVAFADVDGDADQDVLITGQNSSGLRIAKLYTNDGSGNFSLDTAQPFKGAGSSSIAFADVDGDSDPDVLITGQNSSGGANAPGDPTAMLYLNDGGGSFSIMANTPFEGVVSSSVAFADVDGDSDRDVLITGFDDSSLESTKLYTNDGSGNFAVVANTPFEGVGSSSVAFADVDGDSDQDVFITGGIFGGAISKLYLNDGGGTFTEMMGTPFEGVAASSIALSDVDGDSDLDILITGQRYSAGMISKLYLNEGATAGLGNVDEGSIAVSPNPATGWMRVQSVQASIESVALFDLTGRRLPAKISHDRHEAQVRSSYRGLALIKVQTDQGVWVQKLRME